MDRVLSLLIGLKNIDESSLDIHDLRLALNRYGHIVSSKAIKDTSRKYKAIIAEMKEKINVGNNKNLVLKDYLKRDGWIIECFSYVHPGNIKVKMKNVSDNVLKRKSYTQTISDSYMTQISREIYGHGHFEQTEEFDESSLIRKEKKL